MDIGRNTMPSDAAPYAIRRSGEGGPGVLNESRITEQNIRNAYAAARNPATNVAV